MPLVVHDPYFSIWSTSDCLADSETTHWTGSRHGLCGLARIDGKTFRFLGGSGSMRSAVRPDALQQLSSLVFPTRTVVRHAGAGVELTTSFITPALPQDPDLMSRPFTYIDFSVRSMDGREHDIQIYFEARALVTVDSPGQSVVWGRRKIEDADFLFAGSAEQPILAKDGDNLRIDWGYLYLGAVPGSVAIGRTAGSPDMRDTFMRTGSPGDHDDTDMPRQASDSLAPPALALAFSLQALPEEPSAAAADTPTMPAAPAAESAQPRKSGTAIIAYDDLFSIEHMHARLRAWWRRNHGGFASFGELLAAACRGYRDIRCRCEIFDRELVAELEKTGGWQYAKMASLAFRQCLGAHKLVEGTDGRMLYLSKENFSNGCIATVDVTYPSSPFFLLFNPDLLEAQIRPILEYAGSQAWPHPFAPHDLGRYPKANGQVYGGGVQSVDMQMPVEECGNMLILAGALCMARGDASWARPYRALLDRWAEYLSASGLDPENQLCTDDFAGHLARNANLSLKAIIALGAYSKVADMLEESGSSHRFMARARNMAESWLNLAEEDGHSSLAFGLKGTWSQKYNLVWDRILGLGLFPDSLVQTETRFYSTQSLAYGVPLDNRATYGKLDWNFWSAALCPTDEEFEKAVEPLYRWVQETRSRVPLTDWYDCETGDQKGFQARSVVGGLFIRTLAQRGLMSPSPFLA